jgi:hypothetical protein
VDFTPKEDAMRVLSVRPGHRDEDIAAGVSILLATIANPRTIPMIIRGRGPEVSQFADRAAARSDPFPWRDVVWVMDDAIFTPQDLNEWFASNPNDCAVVFDIRDRPRVWLPATAQLFEIEDAFLLAEART